MPPARWLLLLAFFLQSLCAADIGLIRIGDSWRYFKGVAEPAPSNLWTTLDFDDQAWPASRSGFAAYSELTVFPDYGTAYRTLYFRKPFVVTDTNNIADLVFRIDYDDGFVAYLNGVEVVRRGAGGVTNAPVPVTATVLYHARGYTEEILLTNSTSLLQNGTNVFAVQLLGFGEFDYSAAFVPELLANVIRGPFIQNTTPTSAQIAWKTLSRSGAALDFGTNLTNIERIEVDLSETNHLATVSGLQPNTEYHYRIINRFGARETVSDWSSFRTFKESGDVTFHVLGDSGWGTLPQYQIAEQMARSPADLLMHVGDIVYYSITHYNADLRCFSVYQDQMKTMPWFVALGNHDMYVDKQAAMESFYLPTNSVTGTEHYYSFDHGDVHFVVVWSDLQALADYRPGSPQYLWLEEDLGRTTKPWKFMFFHHTWRSSSVHGVWDDYDGNLVKDSVQLDQAFAALARRFGVQMIFNGHDHCYERLAPSGGPISFVSGGGGASLYGISIVHQDSSQWYPNHHFLRVNVSGDVAHVEAVGPDGNVFDRVHVSRSFPTRQTVSAEWNSPLVESRSVGDTNANVNGQSFDFAGAPIIAPMGLFTSSGRLFVNNDRQNLYLGLDEVMLRAGEELFVFVDVPGIPGVGSLAQIGNGLTDSSGEGVDGLDFLSNLIFDGFAPSIGIVLGDEFGDIPSREFLRSGQTIRTGQGAFYLTNGLPVVAGQRLAQYNRSPHGYTSPYEQNANFIELVLPYSELGGLKPGDVIKVGVITALGGIDPTLQVRQLDSSGIGYSVRTNSSGTILEGVAVRLAADPDPDSDGLTDAEEQTLGTNPNNPDSDGDGLFDGWEVRFAFNPLSAGANESSNDNDLDGVTNIEEFQAGTNPLKADSDDDSLPDAWELAHGLDPTRSTGGDGASGDPDADGVNNGMEFRAGTNPRDAGSRLNLRAIDVNGNAVQLSWSAVPGRRYTLQYRDSFLEPFHDVNDPAFPMTAQAATESFTLNFSADLPPRTRYYRVQLVE